MIQTYLWPSESLNNEQWDEQNIREVSLYLNLLHLIESHYLLLTGIIVQSERWSKGETPLV